MKKRRRFKKIIPVVTKESDSCPDNPASPDQEALFEQAHSDSDVPSDKCPDVVPDVPSDQKRADVVPEAKEIVIKVHSSSCSFCGDKASVSVAASDDLTKTPDNVTIECHNNRCSLSNTPDMQVEEEPQSEVICLRDKVDKHVTFYIKNVNTCEDQVIANKSTSYAAVKDISSLLKPALPQELNQLTLNKTLSKSRFGECRSCKKKFFSEAQLTKHMLFFHDYLQFVKISFQCPICKETNDDLTSCVQHVEYAHFNSDNWDINSTEKCDFCSFSCNQKFMKIHMVAVHGIQYSCTLCNYKAKSSHFVEVHVTTHETNAMFPSTFCNKIFTDSVDCQVHQAAHLRKVRQYECHACNLLFAKQEELHLHLEEHCFTPRETNTCKGCGLKIDNVKLWKAHKNASPKCITLEKSSKPNQLPIVLPENNFESEKAAAQPIIYKAHEIRCCGKTFPSLSVLQSHKRADHTNTRTTYHQVTSNTSSGQELCCALCPKKYNQMINFLGHYTSHMNPCCKRCKYSFSDTLQITHCKQHRLIGVKIPRKTDDHLFIKCRLKIGPGQNLVSCNFCSKCNFIVVGEKCSKERKPLALLARDPENGNFVISGSSEIPCDKCAFSTSDPFIFKSHTNCHKGDLFCPLCLCPIPEQSHFQNHFWTYHAERKDNLTFEDIPIIKEECEFATCKFCQIVMQAGGVFHMLHMQDHMFIKCQQCNFVTQSETSFCKHRKTKHAILGSVEKYSQNCDVVLMENPNDSTFTNCYKCTLCRHIFYDWDQYMKHVKLKHSVICPKCSAVAISESLLELHLKRFHALDLLTCQLCVKFNCWTQAEMIDHIKSHQLKCQHCATVFENEEQLTEHYKRKHSGFSYFCKLCKFGCMLKSEFKNHKRRFKHKIKLRNKGLKILKCPKCSFRCLCQSLLEAHQKKTHKKCTSCTKQFSSKSLRTVHMNRNHQGVYSCKICLLHFPGIAQFKQHKTSRNHRMLACIRRLKLSARTNRTLHTIRPITEEHFITSFSNVEAKFESFD